MHWGSSLEANIFSATQEISSNFMETGSSAPRSQQPATRPYTEPNLRSPNPNILLLQDIF